MRKILSTFIILAMLIATIPMTASALVVDDWEISISGSEATIIGYSGEQKKQIVVPAKVGNYNVVAVDGAKLFDEPVEELIFSEGIKNICREPFAYHLRNSLKKVVLPESLEKLDVHFQGYENLESINIPSSIKEINFSQFAGCTNLKKIDFNNVQIIGQSSFSGTGLESITIPNSVYQIGDNAFSDCNSLVNVTIPNNVKQLGGMGFYGEGVFLRCKNLESAIIGDGVDRICEREFEGCEKLQSISLGNSITYIMDSSFSSCPSLKSLIIPNGVTHLGYGIASNCLELESITIPQSVTKLDAGWHNCETFATGLKGEEKPLPKLFIYSYSGGVVENYANKLGVPFVNVSTATPTNSKVVINGKEVAFTAYNIGGNNYFKLRDIASAINGTNKNFNVGWDGNNNAITLKSKTTYSNVGGELVVNSNANVTTSKISNSKIFVDGKLTTFMAFNIADNNYIKLRDLGEVFDFSVNWNDGTQTIEINTNKSYTK